MNALPPMPKQSKKCGRSTRSGLSAMPAMPAMQGQRGSSNAPVMHSPGYEVMINGDVTAHCSGCGERVEAIRIRQGNDHWTRDGRWLIGKHYCNECKPRQFGKINGIRKG